MTKINGKTPWRGRYNYLPISEYNIRIDIGKKLQQKNIHYHIYDLEKEQNTRMLIKTVIAHMGNEEVQSWRKTTTEQPTKRTNEDDPCSQNGNLFNKGDKLYVKNGRIKSNDLCRSL